jgi:hypothetical protein
MRRRCARASPCLLVTLVPTRQAHERRPRDARGLALMAAVTSNIGV